MNEKKKIFVWTLYDFANTSYSIIVVTFLYAVYFKETVNLNKSEGDFYWGLGTSVSMLVAALISPVLGAVADYTSTKKRFLTFFSLVCIVATSLLYFVGPGDVVLGLALLIVANIGFEAGLIFYDSFLPEITKPKNFGRVSGYGYAMGYLGSLSSLLILMPLIQMEMISESFPVAALFFFIFALPTLILLKEHKKEKPSGESYFTIGVTRVIFTIKHLKQYRNLAIFLLSFFFFIEGVNTIIYFAGIYATTTLGFTKGELIIFFMSVQGTAILGSVVFGIISDTIGHKKSLMITLFIWIFTVALAFWITEKSYFYVVGFLAGGAMGSSQSISRALMSQLTPPDKKTEFFGFYSFFGKSSAILGPLVFGLISSATGSQRYAILSLLFFFVAGIIVLAFVKEENAAAT
ncbi:MAG: MFS transporter [Ignavibacteria bacterium]|nr:MFS transporter [Ignavibacteria bacterium]